MTFSREARINGVASPLFNVFVCLHLATHHAAVALALVQRRVRPSGKAGRFRPQANPNQKTAACSGINRAHVCTRGVSRLPRGSNFAQTGRRLDKKDAEGTLELDPGVSGSSPRLLPSLDLSLYYDLLLVLPEARGIGRPGLPASPQLECHAC